MSNSTFAKTAGATPPSMTRFVPRAFKQAAREWLQNATLKRGIREIFNLAPGDIPSRQMLASLQRGWANDGYAARTDYLEALARLAVTTPGPILECGSGLTTILLGLLAGRRGVQTWSLEHVPGWRVRVSNVLERFAIPNVVVCAAPLRSYGEFDWYEAPLESMPPEFQLAICDGPPGTTAGGRYGLLPVLRKNLPDGCVILLDDATRPGELEVLRRWKEETSLRVSSGEGRQQSFVSVTLGK